jgi:Fe-S-cluster-containing dehydrogenase component/DMSO reductase anchor subunit
MQKSFVLDINKCTGCQACQVACQIENQLTPGTSWRWIDTFNEPHHPGIPVFHLSLACNHCADAPCMTHCPALAYSKDPETGAVIVEEAKCIGCKYCTWACPYDAPRFEPASGVVTKCTFCNDRLQEGKNSACVDQCPTGALRLTDRDGTVGDSHVMGFPQTDADPSIRFVPLRDERPYPSMTAPTRGDGLLRPVESKVSVRSEWSLAVFTLFTAFLVGVMSAPDDRLRFSVLLFLFMAVVAAAFSTLHLGRKLRAYRAVLNWRHSWLSREIILFSAFVGIVTIHLLTGGSLALTKWLTALIGFATLFAMDSVYHVTRTPGLRSHSAQVWLTGLFVLGVVTRVAPIFLGVGMLKSMFYVTRKMRFARSGTPVRPRIGAARVVVGLVLPACLWLMGRPELTPLDQGWIVACIAIGEIIDRSEFYLELEIPTPQRQMAMDLEIARVRA